MAELTARSDWSLGGATFLASIATGLGSTILYYLLATPELGLSTITTGAILTLLGIGLGVGLLVIWPICLIATFFGIGWGETYQRVRRRSVWVLSGTAIGALPFLTISSSTGDFTGETLAAVALIGGFPGAFASALIHNLLGITP